MSRNNLNERMQHFRESVQQQQQRGWLQRIFAWLLLGLVLVFGLTLLVISLLLSWLLIPIMLYRNHQRRRTQQQTHRGAGHSSSGEVIEGEIVDKE